MNFKLKHILFVFIVLLITYLLWPEPKLDSNKKVTHIEVLKSERILNLYSGDELLKSYSVSLGRQPVGKKEFEGDLKTPEGLYYINDKNPNSSYYLNLGLSYPNQQDKEFAEHLDKSPGGQIKIHGMRNGFGFVGKLHRLFDWTLGCIAVTNSEMKELYDNVPIGTKIEVKP